MADLAVHSWQLLGSTLEPSLILDIRSLDQFRRGHLPGAVSLPYERFQAEAESLAASSGSILIVDPAGARAAEMAVWLRKKGFDVGYLKGGMAAWRGPLEMA